MSEVVTGIAELGQGALTAQAVEPSHGEPDDVAAAEGHTHESACLNCDTSLFGSYCHNCGQHAHIHRTLAAFFHDLAHGVFHVEGKILRTLPMLALRPGKLTREYIDGRRASYLSPIALFLFSVFLLFAVLHLLEGSDHGRDGSPASMSRGVADRQEHLDHLLRRREHAADAAERTELDRSIEDTRETITAIKRVESTGFATVELNGAGDIHSDVSWIDQGAKAFRTNPDLALYKLQMTAYKYSWLLIPISVPMLWLLFPFSRRFRLYDHTVFVTYSLAFMTLLAVLGSIGTAIGSTIGFTFVSLLWLVVPVHMYRQLRGTYALGWAGTLWRTAALVFFAIIALALFAAALLSVELRA